MTQGGFITATGTAILADAGDEQDNAELLSQAERC